MAPLAGSMRSSEPKESSTHTDPAPDVMLTGSLSGPPTCTVLVTRPAARSTPTIWLADQSEIQAVEPRMVMSPGWPNGSRTHVRTVDGSSAETSRRAGPGRGSGGRPAAPAGHHYGGCRGDQGHRHRNIEPPPAEKAEAQLGVLADLVHVFGLLRPQPREPKARRQEQQMSWRPSGLLPGSRPRSLTGRVPGPARSAPSDVLRMSWRLQPE